ncbi:MAG: hypothetical protein HY372_00830 [Candidatus Andersenbacteria bacterium]|nr:hypothetical protein [Candidatus Andersenbacteria bacterium]
MEENYLSPVFAGRSAADRDFLRQIDGRSGFSLFWLDISAPMLDALGIKHLLEVGADRGQHTRWLLGYCREHAGTLTVIEPRPHEQLDELVAGQRGVCLMRETSAAVLPNLSVAPEAVFLEGDLNFAAVSHDLQALQELGQRRGGEWPVTFVSAVGWPYARRDMYYEPERLPKSWRHEFARRGMSPWSAELVAGGINAPFANANREGGVKNGVLTAVEDFVAAQAGLALWLLPVNHGFGIVYDMNSNAAPYVQSHLKIPAAMQRLLATIEVARINEILRRQQAGRRPWYRRLARLVYG